MIKITCCRFGKFPRNNIFAKGTFIKEFHNMQQLAMFVYRSNKSIFFPYINKELSRKQLKTLSNKVYSLCRKKK